MDAAWSKGLRGGDFTPRRLPSAKQPAAQPEKGRSDKTPLPGPSSGSRTQGSGTSRKPTYLVTDSPEFQQRLESPSKPGSVYSGDGDADGTEDFENDSVQVFVRVRPPTEQELASDKHEGCLTVIGSRTLQLTVKDKQNTTHRFMFDQVLPDETPQHDVFELAGQVAVDNCLAGYNSSIFAYGQTGAGKTFTVIGQLSCADKRGLAPRVFEYLFAKITDHENARGPDAVKYNCRCAFLEIYNETIADLLCPSSNNLPIREDPEKGPYVDGLSEPPALNVDEMLQHLLLGAENRHTGETRLNRESSRSHSVFMCTVEKTITSNGISKCFYAKLNLVDLAGSERIASGAHGGSNAAGEHFKEACHINKSLTALGRVTTELVKSQKNGGGGHVPYRDSKLTFLLQSSLGGNAKTLIIANVSPSSICAHETLSTLRFAKQTKHIRNDAKVNWTVQGDRIAMQREIERLRIELAGMRSGVTEPLVQANEELTARLEEEGQRREELQQERERMVSALNQARRENRLLDQRLVGLAAISSMDGSRGAGVLATVVEQLEALDAITRRRLDEVQELTARQLQAEKDGALQLMQAADEERNAARTTCLELHAQLSALLKEKADLEETCSVLAENFSQAGAKLSEQKEELVMQLASLQEAQQTVGELQRQIASEHEHREEVELRMVDMTSKMHAASEEATRSAARESKLQALLDDKQVELSHQGSCVEALERQLEGALGEVQLLRNWLSEAQEQLAQTRHENETSCSELSDQVVQVKVKLDASEAMFWAERRIVEGLQQELVSARDELAARDQQRNAVGEQLESKSKECSLALERLSVSEANLRAQMEARSAAETEVSLLTSRMAELHQQVSAAHARCEEHVALLQSARQDTAELTAQLLASVRALTESEERTAAVRQELQQSTARTADLEAALRNAEHTVAQLESTVAGLRLQVSSAKTEHAASEERVLELRNMLAGLETTVVELKAQLQAMDAANGQLVEQISRQATEAQDRARTIALLETRATELEAAKATVTAQLGLERTDTATLRDALSASEACISELRKQVQQEEARTLTTRQELSETTASFQQQIFELEELQLQQVQKLKDELDKRNTALQARDKELVQTNFSLMSEINRLEAQNEQFKAYNEQMVASHQAMLSNVNERHNKQLDRYNDLSKKYDVLKTLYEQGQRELESWKTKCERLDHALADVSRLVLFARNPPDSARSSQIITRSEHMSAPRSLYIAESSAISPRVPASRYQASSPAGSKVGSVSHHHGCDDAADECGESASPLPDTVSLGDQLPNPDDAEQIAISDA